MEEQKRTPEELAAELKQLLTALQLQDRNDLILQALGVPLLEQLRIEAARGKLSRLLITKDHRLLLLDYGQKEVVLQPVHKAVFLLFLAHPEGIEFKRLGDYRQELLDYYLRVSPASVDRQQVEESVSRLIDPLDNAINEKCSRIKRAFLELMDEYSASYYIISSHTTKRFAGSSRIWYERLKVINLPRELVIWET
ncbi:MAG: hypothetical protein IKX69_03180 [Prevotella sp.]|nr:hypothetical protein [Prevotella sp.]MBR5698327.1 hypothetical protein [Prevotella sp.]